MRTRRKLDGKLVLVMVFLAVAATGGAQEKNVPEPSRQDKARMEAMKKAAEPGEAHKKLEALVGRFSATVKVWGNPSEPPVESEGVAINTWVLGDRFVHQQFQGTSMGEAFQGFGYTGYDNLKKKYTSVWMDNASTSTMISTGSFDAEGKVLTLSGSMDDPITGKPMKITEKLTIPGRSNHTFEIWGTDSAGKPFKMMEVTYNRER